MKFLVTGANGFVGNALVAALQRNAHSVRRALRNMREEENDAVSIGDINGHTDWDEALRDIDIVIHLAARVHVMHESAADPLAAFREVNVAGTENLARQAAAAGVKRLVYVSSIKVNGEETTDGHVYRETDPPAPQDPYGISKWETEQVLHQIAAETGLEIVIVRPPLVYGPGVKGNFLQLLKAVYAGIPLPLAKVNNARSLLYLGNLVDILLACAIHPAAKGRTYLLRDGEDISVKDLARELGMMLGRRAKMFALPGALLQAMATVIGRQDMWNRLTTSLCLDDAAIRREIGWEPKYTLRQGLQATATWYKGQRNPSL